MQILCQLKRTYYSLGKLYFYIFNKKIKQYEGMEITDTLWLLDFTQSLHNSLCFWWWYFLKLILKIHRKRTDPGIEKLPCSKL
jgi:hypothetical protein